MKKVLIATPAYGGVVTEAYFQSMLRLTAEARKRNVHVDIMTLTNESLITRARNNITATFLAGEWTDLFWIDADIVFTPDHFFKLLDSPHDVCATVYPMKGLDWETMSEVVGSDQDVLRAASVISVVNFAPGAVVVDGFAQCLDAGTGFMRITRTVLEHVIEAHPELEYNTDGHNEQGRRWAIFDTMIADGRYLSEDYAFCRRWQQIGGEVWVDVTSPILGHQGSYTYGK